jgi:Helicase HerA, central domain
MSAASIPERGIFGRGRTLSPQRAAPAQTLEPLVGEAEGERGFVIAHRLSGERALPVAGRNVLLSQERMCRHLLVCGATGSGKTETVMRLAWTVAKESDAPVFYLDGKGDRDTAERFCGLMADAGRITRVFPNEPFDGWRGRAHEIQGRLMEIIDYTSEGPAAWYRDVAKTTLRLVCEHPDGPPRSSGVVLARMNHGLLAAAHRGSSAVAALKAEQVAQVRLRYEAFFGQTRGALDGSWAWEDTKAAYLLLDSLALREETGGLARFLFEDFAHYFTGRKPKHQFCVLIVDEFSALASSSGMAARVEQARGFNTSLVLAPQVVAGMGDATEAERIIGSVESVICHRVNTPEAIIALAGTRQGMEYSTQFAPEGATGAGSARSQHQFKVDPNKVRALEPGMAFLISRGRAMKIQVPRAPTVRAPLPEAVSTPPAPQASGPAQPTTSEQARPDGGPPEKNLEGVVPFGGGSSEKGAGTLPF